MSRRPEIPESLWPYSERAGVGVEQDVDAIISGAEVILNELERERVREFADGLFEGQVGELRADTDLNLEQLHSISTVDTIGTFRFDYFQTETGWKKLVESGYDGENDERAILEYLASMDAKSAKSLAAKNYNWYTDQLADRLQSEPRQDWEYDDPLSVGINYNPNKLLTRLEGLKAYRVFYRNVRRQIREDDSLTPNERQAMGVLLNVHQARVNNMFIDQYVLGEELAEQVDLLRDTDPDKYAEIEASLTAASPVLMRIHQQDGVERLYGLDELHRRLGLLDNGAAWRYEGSRYTASPISPELDALAAEIEKADDKVIEDAPERLPDSVVEILDETEWNADQVKTFLEAVLASWGKLSTEQSDWHEAGDRDGFPADGLYQVVISPKKKSLAVNSTKRVIWVPEEFARKLTDKSPAGVLPLAAHELTHAVQSFFDYELGEDLKLARIKGSRYVTLREAGGLHQERQMHARYFGRDLPSNLHYLRAIKAKLRDGNKLEVARAFYDSYVAGKELDDAELKKARETAVDRSLRFYRAGGHNSQPLDYIEQELIVRELARMGSESTAAFVIAAGSFNTKDIAQLVKADLMEVPKTVDIDPARDVMEIFIRDFLPQILADAEGER